MELVIKVLQKAGLYTAIKRVKDFAVSLTPSYRRHRREMRGFYGQFIKSGDLCYDIGANVGDRSVIFRELGAQVVAVEPQSACVKRLESLFDGDAMVRIVSCALGGEAGEAEIQVSDATTISSLSQEWIRRVRESGRFAAYDWNRTETIAVRTFDALIEEHGVPVFAKIDVEGFEFEVLKGLSQRVGAVSFEFTPEYLEPAVNSIRHLDSLGDVRFNYSVGESMKMELTEWIGGDAIIKTLENLPDASVFGDVYAQFERECG